MTMVLSVLRFTASDYHFGILKLLVIVLSVLLLFTASDYRFGIFKLLTIVLSVLRFTASDYRFGLKVWYLQAFDHCIVCPSSIYGFWLPLWYRQAFDHCIVWGIPELKPYKLHNHTTSKYEIFWYHLQRYYKITKTAKSIQGTRTW